MKFMTFFSFFHLGLGQGQGKLVLTFKVYLMCVNRALNWETYRTFLCVPCKSGKHTVGPCEHRYATTATSLCFLSSFRDGVQLTKDGAAKSTPVKAAFVRAHHLCCALGFVKNGGQKHISQQTIIRMKIACKWERRGLLVASYCD